MAIKKLATVESWPAYAYMRRSALSFPLARSTACFITACTSGPVDNGMRWVAYPPEFYASHVLLVRAKGRAARTDGRHRHDPPLARAVSGVSLEQTGFDFKMAHRKQTHSCRTQCAPLAEAVDGDVTRVQVSRHVATTTKKK